MNGSIRTGGVTLLALLSLAALAHAGSIDWRNDYSRALEEAKQSGKMLLVSVHATWCGPCRRMEQTTFRDPELIRRISESCIAVHVDADRDAGLVQRLSVQSLPTEIFVSPAGRIVGKLEGYTESGKYTVALDKAVAVAGISPIKSAALASNTKEPASNSLQNVSRTTKNIDSPLVRGNEGRGSLPPSPPVPPAVTETLPAENNAPLALSGYCPVSMIGRAMLIPGKDSILLVYKGSRYLFAGEKERGEFETDPARYLPAEGGHCVVTWADEGRWQPGRIDFPALFGDQVFLFPDETHRQKFLRDPERYVDDHGRAIRTTLREPVPTRIAR